MSTIVLFQIHSVTVQRHSSRALDEHLQLSKECSQLKDKRKLSNAIKYFNKSMHINTRTEHKTVINGDIQS